MYQALGDLFGTQRIGSFEGEDKVAVQSGLVKPNKWSTDRKLRRSQNRVKFLKARQARLNAKLADTTDANQIARMKQELEHINAALATASENKTRLISAVAINDSGALAGLGDPEADCVAKGAPAIQAEFIKDQGAANGDPAKLAAASAKMTTAMDALAKGCAGKGSTLKKVLIGAAVVAAALGVFMFVKHKKPMMFGARRRKR